MGYSTAVDMASNTDSLEDALKMHFRGNCYPPIPSAMVPVGVEAIHNVVEAEICRDYDMLDKPIQLPEGIEFRGSSTVSSIDAVEKLFLGAFVDAQLYQSEEE
tara:strand:- start:80 stop:388 length:309 start_codon:yes stop_codon:yes gene_type:complete